MPEIRAFKNFGRRRGLATISTTKQGEGACSLVTCDCLPHVLCSLGGWQERQRCLLHRSLTEAALQPNHLVSCRGHPFMQ